MAVIQSAAEVANANQAILTKDKNMKIRKDHSNTFLGTDSIPHGSKRGSSSLELNTDIAANKALSSNQSKSSAKRRKLVDESRLSKDDLNIETPARLKTENDEPLKSKTGSMKSEQVAPEKYAGVRARLAAEMRKGKQYPLKPMTQTPRRPEEVDTEEFRRELRLELLKEKSRRIVREAEKVMNELKLFDKRTAIVGRRLSALLTYHLGLLRRNQR